MLTRGSANAALVLQGLPRNLVTHTESKPAEYARLWLSADGRSDRPGSAGLFIPPAAAPRHHHPVEEWGYAGRSPRRRPSRAPDHVEASDDFFGFEERSVGWDVAADRRRCRGGLQRERRDHGARTSDILGVPVVRRKLGGAAPGRRSP